MPEKTYPHVRRYLREIPWALEPAALELLCDIIDRRIEGREPTTEEKAAALAAARRQPPIAAAQGSIAVLPIHGLISHRVGMMTDVSGGTSAEALQAAFQAFVRDPNVSAILLDVDSPGGSVYGIQELGETISGARGSKPVIAVANARAASAAYWIAAQADELVVTPSGEVGSIGVFAAHDDVSKAAEQQGVRRTYISAGRFKTEGNPFEPLSDDARAEMQKAVDRYYEAFVRAVAYGRRTSLKNVRENFGEGRMVGADEAVQRGMADRVATLNETIGRLQAKVSRAGARAEEIAAAPVAEVLEEQIAAVETNERELAAARARLELAELAGR